MKSKNISREILHRGQLISRIFWEAKMLLQGMSRLNLMDSMMLYKDCNKQLRIDLLRRHLRKKLIRDKYHRLEVLHALIAPIIQVKEFLILKIKDHNCTQRELHLSASKLINRDNRFSHKFVKLREGKLGWKLKRQEDLKTKQSGFLNKPKS
jgi:hypothetical protein